MKGERADSAVNTKPNKESQAAAVCSANDGCTRGNWGEQGSPLRHRSHLDMP